MRCVSKLVQIHPGIGWCLIKTCMSQIQIPKLGQKSSEVMSRDKLLAISNPKNKIIRSNHPPPLPAMALKTRRAHLDTWQDLLYRHPQNHGNMWLPGGDGEKLAHFSGLFTFLSTLFSSAWFHHYYFSWTIYFGLARNMMSKETKGQV